MTGRKRGRNAHRKTRRKVGLCLILVSVIVLFSVVSVRVQPLLKRLAESKAESVTLRIINDCVNQLITKDGLSYDNAVTVHTDENGGVTFLETDTARLNAFKAQIGSQIQQSFDAYDFGTISLPVGTILGGDFFIGRGPALRFHVELSCTVESTFENVFDDAGINQTRHQILLHISGTTFAVAEWCKTSKTVTTDFIVAEAVIVGEVPGYYTNVEHSPDVLDDINNYGMDVG